MIIWLCVAPVPDPRDTRLEVPSIIYVLLKFPTISAAKTHLLLRPPLAELLLATAGVGRWHLMLRLRGPQYSK